MNGIETDRLSLRRLQDQDAAFVLELVNDPAWLRYIGDKDVHDLDAARRYIEAGPARSYATHGFGLLLVTDRDGDVPVGMCGLLKRDYLDDPDLGFAFLPAWRGRGYARESAAAVLQQARTALALPRVAAITSTDNHDSIRLLERLRFRFQGLIRPDGSDQDANLYMIESPDF